MTKKSNPMSHVSWTCDNVHTKHLGLTSGDSQKSRNCAQKRGFASTISPSEQHNFTGANLDIKAC
jgi:hypothetical protein